MRISGRSGHDPKQSEAADSVAAQGILITEGLVYTGVEAAQQAISIFLLPVFFFFLTPSDLGVITAATAVAQVTMFLSTMGLDFTLLRLYYVWAEDERSGLVTGMLYLALLWSAGLGVVSVIAVNATMDERDVAIAMSAGALGGFALGVRAIPLAVVRVNGAMRTYAIAEVGAAIFRGIVQLVLVVSGLGAAGYMIGYALAPVVSTATLAGSRHVGIAWRHPCWTLNNTVWRYTLNILPAQMFNRLLAISDRLVLMRWGTLDALGVYGAASRFSICLKLLTGGLKMALAPALSRAQKDAMDSNALLFSLSRLLVLAMLAGGSTLMLAAWFVQFTPWSPHWVEVQQLLGLLVLAQVLIGFGLIWQLRFHYSPNPNAASPAFVAGAVVLLSSLTLLVPRYGTIGAAIAQTAAAAASLLALAFVEGRNGPHWTSWRKLMTPAALLCSTIAAIWVLESDYYLYVLLPTFMVYGSMTAVEIVRLRRSALAS